MISPSTPDNDQRIAEIATSVLAGNLVSREQAQFLASLEGDDLYDLFYWANKIRIRFVGRQVKFCSIVTGKTGACSEDCSYCSQSKHYKTHVTPDKMTVDEMLQATEEARANGANSMGIVNSGRGPTDRELDWLEPFYRKTAEQGTIRPCATLGELTPEQAQRLKDMGVQRINHNLETSARHFKNIVSTHDYKDRVQTIRNAKNAGLSICAGGIFGLGEDWDDRIDMALALRELDVDVVPINFLNAIQGTPLYGEVTRLEPMQALHIIAVYKFILPQQELKIAGGREKILRDLQSWIFFAGGSSFLIGNYLTTFGRTPQQDHQMLKDLGLTYTTFDEVEHEAQPDAAMTRSPGHDSPAREGALLSRRDGSLVALPVLNQGEKLVTT
ncbi:biotin synthase BioB [Mucisphaera calidilacus]|uniref:Biotin synthase n=1 Tax=Mucisphaera calidilacus TaxID=2527982 RepID=A0A518BYC5_9BACT|nr:biotin synthase BioB [Mucisphaera calidilacus]QDU71977.1 Biotin synthase [Mucisphaera calidilacus]